ncbi:MAG: hypothetical protein AAFN74_09780 [Myxococcota bacterium]
MRAALFGQSEYGARMHSEVRIEKTPATPTPANEQPRREPLADVVAEVAQDAQIQPEAYLRETIVPADGE